MNQTEPDIDVLIAKVFSHEATDSEHKQLKDWEALSTENEAYAKMGFEILKSAGLNMNWDEMEGWKKLQQKIRKKKQPETSFFTLKKMALPIAATILVLISLGGILRIFFPLDSVESAFQVSTHEESVSDTLPDGTIFYLNHHSSLSYIENQESKKSIATLKGECFFEIAENKEFQFLVEAGKVSIKDIGTAFNVSENVDGVTVFVKSGIVEMLTDTNPVLRLNEGESGIYNSKTTEILKLDTAGLPSHLAYMKKSFAFQNATLKEVVASLNRVYGAGLELENNSLETCKITVHFKEEKFDTMLEVIAEALNLEIRKNKRKIYLSGNPCD